MTITAAKLQVLVGADVSGAVNGLNQVGDGLMKLSGNSRGLGDVFKGVLGASLVTGAVQGMKSLSGEAVTAYAEYERLGMSLESLAAREALATGSATNMADALRQSAQPAQELIQWIQKLAIKSPFTQAGVADAFRMAMAYGFTADESQRLTQTMIDFAAGSGANEASMSRIALALGQIKSKGKLAGQEVLQLTEAGLPVTEILAKAFNVTTGELERMRSEGLIPADAAIEAIVQSLETDFAGAAERQSASFSGLISTMTDLKEVGLREFFTGTFTAIQPQLDAFVNKFQEPETIAKIRELGDAFGETVLNILDTGGDLIEWYTELDEGTKKLLVGLAGVAVVGPGVTRTFADMAYSASALVSAGSAAAKMLPEIGAGIKLMRGGASALETASLGGGALISVLGGVTLAVGSVAAMWVQYNKQVTQTNQQGISSVANAWKDFFLELQADGAGATQVLDAYLVRQEAVNASLENANPLVRIFVNEQKMQMASVRELNTALAGSSKSYDSYIQGVVKGSIAAGVMNDSTAEMVVQYGVEDGMVLQLAQSIGLLTEAQFRAAQTAKYQSTEYVNAYNAYGAAKAGLAAVTEETETSALEAMLALQAESAAADDAARATQEAARAAGEAKTGYLGMAEALKGASEAEVAKQALSGLSEMIVQSGDGSGQLQAAYTDLAVSMGFMDERSMALAAAIPQLNQMMSEGVFPAESFSEVLAALSKEAEDGSVNWQSLVEQFGATPQSLAEMTYGFQRIPEDVQGFGTAVKTTVDQAGVDLLALGPAGEEATKGFEESFVTPSKAGANSVRLAVEGVLSAAKALKTWADSNSIHIRITVSKVTIPSFGGSGVSTRGKMDEMKPEASGGPVFAGSPYWVGEKGPEPFIPAVNGRILSVEQAQAAMKPEVSGGMDHQMLGMIYRALKNLPDALLEAQAVRA